MIKVCQKISPFNRGQKIFFVREQRKTKQKVSVNLFFIISHIYEKGAKLNMTQFKVQIIVEKYYTVLTIYLIPLRVSF